MISSIFTPVERVSPLLARQKECAKKRSKSNHLSPWISWIRIINWTRTTERFPFTIHHTADAKRERDLSKIGGVVL